MEASIKLVNSEHMSCTVDENKMNLSLQILMNAKILVSVAKSVST